jgi:hypothetical protein
MIMAKSKTTAKTTKTKTAKAKATARKPKTTKSPATKAKSTRGKTTKAKATTAKAKPKVTAAKAKATAAKTQPRSSAKGNASKTIAKRKNSAKVKSSAKVTIDRRTVSAGRRTNSGRRLNSGPVPVERREGQRRVKVQRRRQIDPTTCERDYTNDEVEFMGALSKYKRTSGRMFPTCSEVLEVIRNLGYEKRPKVEPALPPVNEMPSEMPLDQIPQPTAI